MASFNYGIPQYHSIPSHSSHSSHGHHGRSRRAPRINSANAHRQYKAQRSPKEVPVESTPKYADYVQRDYWQRLEAAKSFELEDDEIFCPSNLLTEDDLLSIQSSSASERSSLSSGSPANSPLQHQAQPLSTSQSVTNPYAYYPGMYSRPESLPQPQPQVKIHQPMAQRTRNAIPIVDPSTRSVASPPMSVSPGRQLQQQQQQQYAARRW